MTEKQYKGIAGNFLICDVQKEYAEHLLSILVKRFGMRFQFHFFSNVKKIEQFAEKAEIEILLIAEDCVSEIRGNVKAKKKFILSESMKKEEKQGETTIFRYQSADEILKIIQSGIGEESPETFKGGDIWSVMLTIHDALKGIGYGLLVLFFAISVVKTCSSYLDVKKPEHKAYREQGACYNPKQIIVDKVMEEKLNTLKIAVTKLKKENIKLTLQNEELLKEIERLKLQLEKK